jgi:hypothetical protein
LLEPAVELSSDEQAVLSQLEAPADTSAAESAVLAAVPGAVQAGSEATPQTTEEDATPSDAPADEADTAAAAARPRPWKEPKWCIDAGVDNTWYIERMRGCGIWRSEVNAIDVRTGRKVGGIKYLVVGYSFSARDSKTWAYQVRLLESSRWGRGVNGTKASGNASCVGKCKVVNKSFPAQTISKSAEPYGQFYMAPPSTPLPPSSGERAAVWRPGRSPTPSGWRRQSRRSTPPWMSDVTTLCPVLPARSAA